VGVCAVRGSRQGGRDLETWNTCDLEIGMEKPICQSRKQYESAGEQAEIDSWGWSSAACSRLRDTYTRHLQTTYTNGGMSKM